MGPHNNAEEEDVTEGIPVGNTTDARLVPHSLTTLEPIASAGLLNLVFLARMTMASLWGVLHRVNNKRTATQASPS